jgi:hypothetical protein
MSSSNTASHKWRFFRSGGFDQVTLSSGEDLRHLAQLDPKLWTVLNCPTTGLEFDARTAALLDSDGDGQIRVPEILAAVQWACSRVVDADLFFREPGLPVDAIAASDEEGAALKQTASRILAYLSKDPEGVLQVSDFSDMSALFAPGNLNGDGIVTAALSSDPEVQTLLGEIIATQGPVADRSGADGVSGGNPCRLLRTGRQCGGMGRRLALQTPPAFIAWANTPPKQRWPSCPCAPRWTTTSCAASSHPLMPVPATR